LTRGRDTEGGEQTDHEESANRGAHHD
jgi:hypothetical protein